jgi:transposase-like protein
MKSAPWPSAAAPSAKPGAPPKHGKKLPSSPVLPRQHPRLRRKPVLHRCKRGRGTAGKSIVFGLFKRGNCVYTEIVPNACKATLQAIIRGKVDPNSVIHTDGWRGYDGLVDMGFDKHFRVNHGNNEFVRGSKHVNGIESFWSYAKHRLAQFHGVRTDKFELHLKESEFRFNYRHDDLYKVLLQLLRTDPL